MKYDALIIGAGLSGLAAASILAKNGLKVAVAEQTFKPGGTCGTFKRNGVIFDQGSAMLYGFGEKGFNSHRFLYNYLEEQIDVIRHEELYSVYFLGQRIIFYTDIERYIEQLAQVFPEEKENLKRFYAHIQRIYDDVIAGSPNYTTADETDLKKALRQMVKHPISYMRFLTYLNTSTEHLLKRYFKTEGILNYFNKLTSTYCYTNVKETPAVLAAIMFVDNHNGGSYYPMGSTIFVPGLLEKAIEEHDGKMMYDTPIREIIVENGTACGAVTEDGERIEADAVIYSGTVWNLYGTYLSEEATTEKKRAWAAAFKPTYPSVVLYATVKKEVIPKGTSPITLFTRSETTLDDDEVTAYILSIDDPSLCSEDFHTVAAIGPTLKQWLPYSADYARNATYQKMKEEERIRLLNVMEGRFPGFCDAVVRSEVATPLTIERYTKKNGGAVAGPLQAMGQHMLKRLHTRTEINRLYCCGESTVMGTGTPTVTVEGISAANALLKDLGMPIAAYLDNMPNYVTEHPPGTVIEREGSDAKRTLMRLSSRCEYCEHPPCMQQCTADIRGINRRLTVGNTAGAKHAWNASPVSDEELRLAEHRCIRNADGEAVAITQIITLLKSSDGEQS